MRLAVPNEVTAARTVLCFLGLLLFGMMPLGGSVGAQEMPAPVLLNADSRAGVDLSGTWHYSIDPYRDGLAGFHGGEAGTGHRRYDEADPQAEMRRDTTALYEYDMRLSPTTKLPSSWLTENPALRYYDGLVWYQRSFTATRRNNERAFLRFGAVNYTARVYLNGHFAGAHEGGFTPFALEVTALLKNGENRVTVGVDSVHTASSVPPPVTDWDIYGGITRAVRLVYVPATFVDDAFVRLAKNGRIAATVRLDGPSAAARDVRVSIPALGLALSGRTGADGSWSGDIAVPAALKLWSPEAPALYDVEVSAGGDVLRDRLGFRTIEVRGEDILLNGKPIFLRGISLHEEEFGTDPTRNITEASARALLAEAKALNANFVRLAHYPHSEITTRLADEMGLLVWSEIPVYWLVDFANPQTLALARRMLAENILRDRNRASIILWSVGNETPPGDARNAFLGQLADDARALDGTRLITAALLTDRRVRDGHVEMAIDDPLIPHLDVMAINTYAGWYGSDTLASLPSVAWTSHAGKPMIFSEFGADALAGFHDPKVRQKFSEEYQAEYYRQTLAMSDKIPFLRGMSPWILKDFRSPRRQHPVFQQGWNRKGLVSETGRRKLAFAVLAEHYRRLKAEWQARSP
jgi:beta-glucuronidase